MLRIMHHASPDVKCLLHADSDYLIGMGEAGQRLKAARERAGYETAKDAADAIGVPVATYIQHENGTRGFPATKADRYARFFRVTPEWLLYGRADPAKLIGLGPRLRVVGEVAAGVFKEAWRYEREDQEAFMGRPDIAVPARDRFGLRVVGDSMDLLYPPGTILECCKYLGVEPIPTGKRVIVQRTRKDGTVEATVKELWRGQDGIEWLVPRSTNPMHTAFRGDEPGDDDIKRVEIIGVVLASTRLE